MPMPGIIIAEQLGLDADKVATLSGGLTQCLAQQELLLHRRRKLEPMQNRTRANCFWPKSLRSAGGTNQRLMSAMVHSHGEDEEPLTMAELQNLMHQLITGGFETTQTAINHGMWTLIRHPELQKLREDSTLIKPFVDEVLDGKALFSSWPEGQKKTSPLAEH